jgi:hypothetical protein
MAMKFIGSDWLRVGIPRAPAECANPQRAAKRAEHRLACANILSTDTRWHWQNPRSSCNQLLASLARQQPKHRAVGSWT